MPEYSPIDALGDFVFACGPRAHDWVARSGLTAAPMPADWALATRGAVFRGTAKRAGTSANWLAVGDLVAGHFNEPVLEFDASQRGWRGRFARVAWQSDSEWVEAVTDHFATLPIYVLTRDDTLLVSSDARLMLATAASSREIDLEAIYHYLNFGCIPAPSTICTDVRRIEPGTRVIWENSSLRSERYFVPAYSEDLRGNESTLAADLKAHIAATVHTFRPDDRDSWGCFLSGGTDSSSIVSLLAKERPERRVRTFSIGFAEPGYDETAYARVTAEACGAAPETGTVDRAQTIALLDRIVSAYDQPFGNSSAIPTLACADLAARSGIRVLLGGDGGDEIFGGNQRYAKDHVMESFYRLPPALKSIGRGIGKLAGGTSSHWLNRIENFVERGSLPNPDRFYTDDSFASDYYDKLLTPAFRAKVDADASLRLMRSVYALGTSASPLHRIMRLDLLMAIAQNDITKVHGACKSAGITARFPYIDPALVAYTGRLPQSYKVRGLSKRYLFKRAMRDILPEAVLRKKKQGFGLPIAIWLRSDRAFQTTVRDILFDPRTCARGFFDAVFVEGLIAEHLCGSWDHSGAIWALVVLELWLRKYFDGP